MLFKTRNVVVNRAHDKGGPIVGNVVLLRKRVLCVILILGMIFSLIPNNFFVQGVKAAEVDFKDLNLFETLYMPGVSSTYSDDDGIYFANSEDNYKWYKYEFKTSKVSKVSDVEGGGVFTRDDGYSYIANTVYKGGDTIVKIVKVNEVTGEEVTLATDYYGGSIKAVEGNLYYINKSDYKVYKIESNGTKKGPMTPLGVKSFEVVDNKIVYVDKTNAYLYSCNIDGTGNKALVSSKLYDYVYASEGWIYYTDYATLNLYRILSDGTNSTKIFTADRVSVKNGEFYARGNKIFYKGALSKLYSYIIDESSKVEIADKISYIVGVNEDEVYYINNNLQTGLNDFVYKVKSDGSGKQVVGTQFQDGPFWIELKNQHKEWVYGLDKFSYWVRISTDGRVRQRVSTAYRKNIWFKDEYFVVEDTLDKCIDIMNYDGNVIKKISDLNGVKDPVLYGDYLYYANNSDSSKLYRKTISSGTVVKLGNETSCMPLFIHNGKLWYTVGNQDFWISDIESLVNKRVVGGYNIGDGVGSYFIINGEVHLATYGSQIAKVKEHDYSYEYVTPKLDNYGVKVHYYNGYFYFNSAKENCGICRVAYNGTEIEKLLNVNLTEKTRIMEGNWLHGQILSQSDKVYSVNVDTLETVEIGGMNSARAIFGEDGWVYKVGADYYIYKYLMDGSFKSKLLNISSDTTNPTMNVSKGSYDSANRSITISVSASDDVGIDRITCSNGQSVKSSEASFIIKENGTYTIRAIDTSGNQVTENVVITEIIPKNPLNDAIAAVDLAELTKSETDINTAKELVNSLSESSQKQELLERLKIVEATVAVELAESTGEQSDVDSARGIVDGLVDGVIKTELSNRLDTLQEGINNKFKLLEATEAVEKAEVSKLQEDLDDAKGLVDKLEESAEKQALLGRIQVIQDYINTMKTIGNAVSLVEKAELSKLQEDLDEAKLVVEDLHESVEKTELLQRLANLQAEIDYNKQLSEATLAVIQAEYSLKQEDFNIAVQLVLALPNNDDSKRGLVDRLDLVKAKIALDEAEKYIIIAETTKTQEDIDIAKLKMDYAKSLIELLPGTWGVNLIDNVLNRLGLVNTVYAAGLTKVQLVEEYEGLQERVDIVQIDVASGKVIKAETSRSMSDIAEAENSITKVTDPDIQNELQNRMDNLREDIERELAIKQATEAVEKAKQTKAQVDLDNARGIVNNLHECSEKTELSIRLDVLQDSINKMLAISAATNAVIKAEQSKKQTDIDSAKGLVEALHECPERAGLLERLEAINEFNEEQDRVKLATQAVEKAESTLLESDYNTAKVLVGDLAAGDVKNSLMERLQDVKNIIDFKSGLEKAAAAVDKAEISKLKIDIDVARLLVNKLPDCNEKYGLIQRLNNLQVEVDEYEKLKEATEAVEKAEQSKLQKDLDGARNKVHDLVDGKEKADLNNRLDNLQMEILERNMLDKAGEAVDKVKESPNGTDYDKAKELVDNLPDGTDKDELLNILKDILEKITQKEQQLVNTAIQAVELAEQSKLQLDVDTAFAKVRLLKDGDIKTGLLDRLREVQRLIDVNKPPENLLNDAKAKVKEAETLKTQQSLNSARDIVDLLPDCPEKTELNTRLNNLQNLISILDKLGNETVSQNVYNNIINLIDVVIEVNNQITIIQGENSELNLNIDGLNDKISWLEKELAKKPTGETIVKEVQVPVQVPMPNAKVEEEIKKLQAELKETADKLLEALQNSKSVEELQPVVYIISNITDKTVQGELLNKVEVLKEKIILNNTGEDSRSVILFLGESTVSLKEGKKHDAIKMDVVPYTINDRTLVPIRFVMEAFKAEVDWNESEEIATVLKGNTTITLKPGSEYITVDGIDVKIDTVIELVNNRMMIPLRFISEGLGYEVLWDETTEKITVRDSF